MSWVAGTAKYTEGSRSRRFLPLLDDWTSRRRLCGYVATTLGSYPFEPSVVVRVIAQIRGPVGPWGRPRGGPPRVPGGGAPGGQDRGYDPNHRVRHPPRWCGSGATPRYPANCRSVIPFWGLHLHTMGKIPQNRVGPEPTPARPRPFDHSQSSLYTSTYFTLRYATSCGS
jgi:hypothetical protein